MKKVSITPLIILILIIAVWYLVIKPWQEQPAPVTEQIQAASAIMPSKSHPQFWAMNGENIMLLGGSVEDNLFQLTEVEKQLDLLKSVGGNYVRNTLSSRDEGNAWPFDKNESGLYNLNTWNATYWDRLENFLHACAERDIIVQIELWATFDFYRENWDVNPFNPKNNINYTTERSHLPEVVNTHPIFTENNFFWSVPSQESNLIVLNYQQRFIDKVLSHTLKFDNILYCMDNETSVTSEWGKFWSLYIKKIAKESGKNIYTTEMWDPWDLDHAAHRETFDHPEIYDFVDISQNNHNSGDTHWSNGLKQIDRLTINDMLRPLNNVKVYGNDGGRHQTTQNAIESFVRNVLFGSASTRFHRPTSGQGLNELAQHVIKSMRSYIDQSDFFNAVPANHLLSEREENEAFCRAVESNEYAIYFPDGGSLKLTASTESGEYTIKWLNILESTWTNPTSLSIQNSILSIDAPDKKNWLAFIKIH